jgi:hypothetical protein
MDPIPGSGMAGDPLTGSPADPAMQSLFNSPQGMFPGRSSRRGRGGPMVARGKLGLAISVVFLACFVAVAVFIIVQIASNQPPKTPSLQNYPTLNGPSLGSSQSGGSVSP